MDLKPLFLIDHTEVRYSLFYYLLLVLVCATQELIWLGV